MRSVCNRAWLGCKVWSAYSDVKKPRCDPIRWGLGRGQLVKNLTEELLKYGIPLIAQEAIKALWQWPDHQCSQSSPALKTAQDAWQRQIPIFFCLGLTVPLLSLNSKPGSSITQIRRNLTLLSMTSPSRLPTLMTHVSSHPFSAGVPYWLVWVVVLASMCAWVVAHAVFVASLWTVNVGMPILAWLDDPSNCRGNCIVLRIHSCPWSVPNTCFVLPTFAC